MEPDEAMTVSVVLIAALDAVVDLFVGLGDTGADVPEEALFAQEPRFESK